MKDFILDVLFNTGVVLVVIGFGGMVLTITVNVIKGYIPYDEVSWIKMPQLDTSAMTRNDALLNISNFMYEQYTAMLRLNALYINRESAGPELVKILNDYIIKKQECYNLLREFNLPYHIITSPKLVPLNNNQAVIDFIIKDTLEILENTGIVCNASTYIEGADSVFGTFFSHQQCSFINNIGSSIFLSFILFGFFNFFKKTIKAFAIREWYHMLEIEIYNFFLSGTIELCGRKGSRIFGVFLTIFLYLVLLNILGLVLFAVTVKSQIATTFWFSITIFVSCILLGLQNKKKEFFFLFWNTAVAMVMRIVLLFVELLSFFIRPLSYALRLFANLLSGHILLHLFSKIINVLQNKGKYSLLPAPVLLLTMFSILETLIAGLQSFIPATLAQIWVYETL